MLSSPFPSCLRSPSLAPSRLLRELSIRHQPGIGRGGGIRTPKNGFGDRRFTVEPTPLNCHRISTRNPGPCQAGRRRTNPARVQRLLHFAMVRVLAALTAKFAELETFGRGLAVLGRRVILILAHRALQLNNFARHSSSFRLPGSLAAEPCPGPSPDIGRRLGARPPSYFRLQPNCSPLQSLPYSISVIVPAPTVRPPSRIAKRSPFSIATGVISSISSVTLSPGITISTPSGNFATPVTSVVRK
jgi:hypothetical protein